MERRARYTPRKGTPAAAQGEAARVTASHGRHFFVTLEDGTVTEAHRRGKKSDVVVGDVVRIVRVHGLAAIESVEERRNLLYRSDELRTKSLAANIDLAAFVFASEPAFSPWFLWKGLVAAHAAGIPALLIRNKSDVAAGAEETSAFCARMRAMGADVIEVSATGNPQGMLAALEPWFAGRTVLLAGQSGMGKSSIRNVLCPDSAVRTQEHSRALNIGRQTTTDTRLTPFVLGGKEGSVIDSPGFQEFGLKHVCRRDILEAMPDIAQFACGCRFYNCTHLHEPGCGVLAALEEGKLSRDRWEFYKALCAEAPEGDL